MLKSRQKHVNFKIERFACDLLACCGGLCQTTCRYIAFTVAMLLVASRCCQQQEPPFENIGASFAAMRQMFCFVYSKQYQKLFDLQHSRYWPSKTTLNVSINSKFHQLPMFDQCFTYIEYNAHVLMRARRDLS